MFRRRLLRDINHSKKESVEAKCPQCEGLMADMGLDFKAPRTDDIKEWSHLKDLHSVGITFHSCGCSGPGYIPKNKEQILSQLENTKRNYIEHFRLWNTIELPETKAEFEVFYQRNFQKVAGSLPQNLYKDYKKRKLDKNTAIKYWTDKIGEIDRHLESLSPFK
ncbi:hypothetical protein JGH11_09170 [Dysgonomonas sp. Marseille-P4677]|uniref:hypothetical protein n=1 Tax=Dysgonomonas sp. Marseille-P4677 TaxID=2364790 RepID=UPI0019119B5A|nr:hypothetical protein [Dysgonomonas sp. Marseille-P4677]MBK5721038.1 hypothetical protein [Dysgonomonas sp. Marseille-P4677]